MSNLNFGSLATAKGVASNKRLKSWEIYKVKFMGCSVTELEGKKDPTAKYKLLVTRFENDNGYYEERTFFPNDESTVRPTYTNSNGHEYEGPSNWEQIQTYIIQLITNIAPEKLENFQKASSKFKSFDNVCKGLISITTPHVGKEVYIKLIGKSDSSGRVNPAFPRICAVNSKDGSLYVSDNFISDKEGVLGYSDYEEGKRKEMRNATPTDMNTVEETAPESKEEDEDFDSLL